MIMSRQTFNQICKTTAEYEIAINVDDKLSEVLNRPRKYPKTTIQEKHNDYNQRLIKNPNSTRNKENFNYIKSLMKEKSIEISEIETEIINRNRQKREGNNLSGIYGYFDTKKGIWIYIGKDSNININLRDTQHHADNSQKINRILRNDKEGRYEYHVLKTMENPTDKELDDAERYYIKLHNTYHYENPSGMNFTKGGETTYGIETEAEIDYNKTINKIKNTYKGERDGIKIQKRDFGKNGDTFKLTTNGSVIIKGEKVPKLRIENIKTKGGKTKNGDMRVLLREFKEGFGDSKLIISDRIRNEYKDILTEFGY